jgi:chaperonin GroES
MNMTTSIKPIRDFVAIKKDETGNKTPGGIYIPATASEEQVIMGTVVAIGSGKLNMEGKAIPMELAVNSKVAFNKGYASELKIANETFFLIRESEVLCALQQQA